jgi:hypothetical protein
LGQRGMLPETLENDKARRWAAPPKPLLGIA